MNCDQAKNLLGAYLDGEVVDLVRVQEIEAHLAECSSCRQEMEALQAVSSAVRAKATYYEAPVDLEARIRARTGVAVAAPPTINRTPWFQRLGYGFAFCAPLLIAGVFVFRGQQTGRLESDLVAGHFRSLQAQHLFDVPSSDRHTVKPWFQGKLDFSPTVPNLATEGFPLLGGRLDYVNGSPAAALVYSHGKHMINVFVMHSTSASPGGVESRDGYRLVKWTSGGLDYWAVSDVNSADLEEFARKFQASG